LEAEQQRLDGHDPDNRMSQVIGQRKTCCQNPANLNRVQVQADMWVSMCRECGCKHWEAAADPGRMGVKFL
jgi:hypothetical protein